MTDKEKIKTPLGEIMNTVESSISGFGLPPLPPLSKLIPGRKEEEPEEAKKPVAPTIVDVREVDKREEGVLGPTDTRWSSAEFNPDKVYDCGIGRTTPLPKAELRIRDVFVRQSPPDKGRI